MGPSAWMKSPSAPSLMTRILSPLSVGVILSERSGALAFGIVFEGFDPHGAAEAALQQFGVNAQRCFGHSFAGEVRRDVRHGAGGEHGALHGVQAVSYTHLRAHETVLDLVCRLLLEKKKTCN